MVQDNIFREDVVIRLKNVAARPRHLLVLRPSIAVIEARDEARRRLRGKVAYEAGALDAEGLDAFLEATPRIGLWLNTSAQTSEETVAEILERRLEARVESGP